MLELPDGRKFGSNRGQQAQLKALWESDVRLGYCRFLITPIILPDSVIVDYGKGQRED